MKLKKSMNPIYQTPILNNIGFPRIQFRSITAAYPEKFEPVKDSFSTNPLYENYWDKDNITKLAKSNPEIMRILKENKIPLKVNSAELEKLKHGHLIDTRVTAAKIYSALPKELKMEINPQTLQQAAMLHDYGKALIPNAILNKNGKLTNRRLIKEEGGTLFNNEVIRMMKNTAKVDIPPTGFAGVKFTADVFTENGVIKIKLR